MKLCSSSPMPMFRQQGSMGRTSANTRAPQPPAAAAHDPTTLEAQMQVLHLDEPAPEPPIEEATSTDARTGRAPRARSGSGNGAASSGSASSRVATAESLTGDGTRGVQPNGHVPSQSELPNSVTTGHQAPGATGVQHEPWSYAVWRTAGNDIRGVHVGGSRAWTAILQMLPGGQYDVMTSRLRRFPTEDHAVRGYLAEARRHGAPMPPRRFYH